MQALGFIRQPWLRSTPWLFGGSARGLGGGGRRGRPAPVQVIHVGHDELAPLLGHAVQHQVPLVVLQDLLHVLQVLIGLLDQLFGSESKGDNTTERGGGRKPWGSCPTVRKHREPRDRPGREGCRDPAIF